MRRRDFLRTSGNAALLSSVAVGLSAAQSRGAESPEPTRLGPKGGGRYRVGLIGTGWYGKVDLFRLMQVGDVEVVGLCDVDDEALNQAAELVAQRQPEVGVPKKYKDYRQMLSEGKYDIILIGTPDHWHALTMIAAVEHGADVYVQKPIGVDVEECLAMTRVAREHNAVVQVGLQRRSTPHLIKAKKEIIESGALGHVGQVEIYSYYGGPGKAFTQEPETPPEGFDYEMWCGPAPKLPYYPCLRRRSWRQFMEYGNGTLGDMGVHMFDMARWLLDLGYPKRIFSTGGQYVKRGGISNCSDTQTVNFEYDDLMVTWNHRTWAELPDRRHPWGGYFYGANGLLKASVFGYDFHRYYSDEVQSVDVQTQYEAYPEDQTEPGIELHCAQAIRDHMTDFLTCIAERKRPRSDIEQGAISTICCVLGNLSMKLGRALEWDAQKNCVRNDEQANALLARAYREPWRRP
ncbi:MAG: Gfo/Idh/MocA family oxidoreductase [Planctomycetia bacterium]|nr:Gfo/Idh/MocA family oxidoreductase [Planctomycetia bacterium]